MNSLYFDYAVLGSGIAGLTFALEAATTGRVLVISKTSLSETNKAYAQSGIAAVLSNTDCFEQHVQDTLAAGAGLCDEQAVRMMVERAPQSITWLQDQGVNFGTEPDTSITLGLEGGHCQHRIAQVKDHTGLSIQQALSKAVQQHPNITILEHHMGIELLTQRVYQETICYGIRVFDMEKAIYIAVLAKAVVLATGGSGQVYQYTTNPTIATSDGLTMAYRAGASIKNMEFFQFHPTALYQPDTNETFLISGALRGAGAELVLPDGTAFMQQYHEKGSLAPSDIVAQAVYEQMHVHNLPCLYLDATRLPAGYLQKHFPLIYSKCKSIGIDAAVEFIPVFPAAHYQCGGVQTDLEGQTSISGLYAVGEVAYTGAHGANRLASNSLLEGVVFGRAAAEHASIHAKQRFSCFKSIVYSLSDTCSDAFVSEIRTELQTLMWEHAGIVKTTEGLATAKDKLIKLKYRLEQCRTFSVAVQELQNMLTTAELIIQACLSRTQSIGGHYLSSATKFTELADDTKGSEVLESLKEA